MTKQLSAIGLTSALVLATSFNTAIAHEITDGGLVSEAQLAKAGKTIHQYGMPLSLLNTVYEGDLTVGEMAQQGDIGLGTVNHLEGELVALDGVVYTIDPKGKIAKAPANLKSPYMTMIRFQPTHTAKISEVGSIQELGAVLKTKMDSENSFYAYKMKGTFPYLKMASAHKVQDEDMPLFEYLATREMYTRENIKGSLVGLFTPEYLGNISIPGLHLHFLSDDLTLGGHVEDIKLDEQTVEIEEINQIRLSLPQVSKFRDKPLKQMPVPAATTEK